ncbi:hypothetical protein PoB_007489000 [Plakobranchus ocellatus]|uniref:Shugoshin C-terminal domain-containing protein n=1 Tax=Plakobranchus ocellatus TaxID=259542 RepID=A0AAV4DW46_9GAST|nr:hypothetical protein PoB_007489000 [Plakobranchus ocellatus]
MMDTPLNVAKVPRRKLKKVLKKTKNSAAFSHNNSSHQLYQKKIKSAINTSLNLTSNVRTLQANNRSLAIRVEKLRGELRLAMDVHTGLLRQNHNLNERILELERQLDMAPSIIDHEVNSRYQAKLQKMQSQLELLISNASVSTKILGEMKDQCFLTPRKSGSTLAALSLRRSTRSSQCTAPANFSPGSTLTPQYCDTDHEMRYGQDKSPEVLDEGYMQELSQVVESSYLEDKLLSTSSLPQDLDQEFGMFQHVTSLVTSRPLRRKHISRLEAGDCGDLTESQLENREAIFTPITCRSPRQKKYSDFETEMASLSKKKTGEDNIQNLLENMDTNTNEEAFVGCEEETEEDLHGTITIPVKKNNIKGCNEKAQKTFTKTASLQVLKSPSLYIRNEFELVNAHKQWLEKTDGVSQKSEVEAPAATLHLPENDSCEQTTHTIKDMELTMGVFDEVQDQEKMVFTSWPCTDTQLAKQSNQSSIPKEPHPDSFSQASQPTSVSLENSEEDKHSRKEKSMFLQSRSRQRHNSGMCSDDNMSDFDNHTESTSIPDGVTMHVKKGGKLMFAVGRKGADGSRPSVPLPIRARSKPKKAGKSECLEQSVGVQNEEKAQTIFDFHDKTPKGLQQKQEQTSMSVFSLSADESVFSPLGSLNKLRKANKEKSSEENSVELSKETFQNDGNECETESQSPRIARSESVSRFRGRSRRKQFEEADKHDVSSESESLTKDGSKRNTSKVEVRPAAESAKPDVPWCPNKNFSTLVGQVYCEPLKGSPEVKTRYRTRSQSRGRTSSRQSPESAKKVRSKSIASDTRRKRNERDNSIEGNLEDNLEYPEKEKSSLRDSAFGKPVLSSANNAKILFEGNEADKRKSRPTVRGKGPSDNSLKCDVKNKAPVSSAADRDNIEFDAHVLDEAKANISPEGIIYREGLEYSLESNNMNRLPTTYDKSLERSSAVKDNVLTVKKDQEGDGKSKDATKDSRVRSRSHETAAKQLVSPATKKGLTFKTEKHLFNKLSNSSNKEFEKSEEPALQQTAFGPVLDEDKTADETKLKNRKGEIIRRRLASSQGRSIYKTKAEQALAKSVSGNRQLESSMYNEETGQGKGLNGAIEMEKDSGDGTCLFSEIEPNHLPVDAKKAEVRYGDKKRTENTGIPQHKGRLCMKNGKEIVIEISNTTEKISLCNTQTKSNTKQISSPCEAEKDANLVAASSSPLAKTSSKDRQKGKLLKNTGKKTGTQKSDYERRTTSGKESTESEMCLNNQDKSHHHPKLSSPDTGSNAECSRLLHTDQWQSSDISDQKILVGGSQTVDQKACSIDATNEMNDSVDLIDYDQRSDKKDLQSQDVPAALKNSHNKVPKISKIVKSRAVLFNFTTDPDSSSSHVHSEGRKRRAASNVNYAAPPLNSKLRRGDPFTSHYAAEKISIYKSPKSKAKEKAKLRRDILGSLHNLAIKEHKESADTEQD